jgi:hypothetical protein
LTGQGQKRLARLTPKKGNAPVRWGSSRRSEKLRNNDKKGAGATRNQW